MSGYDGLAVLSETLKASSKGEAIKEPYRALLMRRKSDAAMIVKIQQRVKGEWSGCGQWGLSTLLFSWPPNLGNKPNDGLSLDFGQQWQIDSGMIEALEKAVKHI